MRLILLVIGFLAAQVSQASITYGPEDLYRTYSDSIRIVQALDSKGGSWHGTAWYIGHGRWVTAAHVVHKRHGVVVGNRQAIVEALNTTYDVAVLRSEGAATPIPLCEYSARIAEQLTVIGYPLRFSGFSVVTSGIANQYVEDFGAVRLLTSVPIYPGDSGAPVLTDKGCAVGVAVSVEVDTSSGLPQFVYSLSEAAPVQYLHKLGVP